MLRIFPIHQKNLTVITYVAFFASLLFAPNDINSKVLLLMAFYSLFHFNLERFINYCKQHCPLLILFTIICASLIYTENLDVGLKKIQRVAIIPVAMLIFSSLSLSMHKTMMVLRLFIVTILVATLYSHILILIDFYNNI